MANKQIIIVTVALTLAAIVLFVAFRPSRTPAPVLMESSESIRPTSEILTPPSPSARDNFIRPGAPAQSSANNSAAAPPAFRTPQQLVAEILEISSAQGPITAEKAEKYKRNLEELIKQGAGSVPAIRELLDKKVEYDFADVSGGEKMGYASLRASLIDTLKQIGGPDAQEAMVHVLQSSALPSELLEVAKNLDQDAPGQYRDQIVIAARESIAMATTNPAAANIELGPAFRILQNYGDANTTADAARNEPANFNNAINLANMPEGQGLATLVQMAGKSSSASGQTIATEMIAQMAGDNSKAVAALMQMAQNGQISNGTWEKLAPILGGDQMQIANSPIQNPNSDSAASQNPAFTIVNNTTTSDQINQRIALIDQFLGIVPSDSSAAASLRNQRNLLAGKLGK